jgi:TRAP-type C4-dicarboxylate transport system permease small subunit
MNSARLYRLFDRFTAAVAGASLGLVFVLFIYGVAMRYLFDRPISWVDEVVTLLTVWSVLWTAAFRLRWSEHISFDIVFVNLSPRAQRLMLLVILASFVALMLAALPGLIDYTLFLWRERTDMLGLRLDFVYAALPLFFIVIVIRMLQSIAQLLRPAWRSELEAWGGSQGE